MIQSLPQEVDSCSPGQKIHRSLTTVFMKFHSMLSQMNPLHTHLTS